MKKPFQRPLGKVLHIVGNEAICQPLTSFKGRGWKVVIDDEVIGMLGDPFGNVERPYQPIILKPHVRTQSSNFTEKEAFAIPKKKKSKYRSKNRSNNRAYSK